MQKFAVIILFIALPSILFSQSKKEKKEVKVKTEEIDKPDISTLEPEDTLADVDLKVKKNTFYGERTKRRWTVSDVQGRTQVEEFYSLKEPVEVDAYAPNVFVYDKKKKKIVNAKTRSGLIENVLHGPYKRLLNNKVVQEGMFFHGVKHERWMDLTLQQQLNDKEHYFKGWYRDSEITYYDPDQRKKVKEVTPIQYGKKEGMYYYFYEDGQLAVRGRYEFDKKVGIWEEFYNTNRTTLKREVQYAPDPFRKNFRTYVRKEWDRFANPIYETSVIGKSL